MKTEAVLGKKGEKEKCFYTRWNYEATGTELWVVNDYVLEDYG